MLAFIGHSEPKYVLSNVRNFCTLEALALPRTNFDFAESLAQGLAGHPYHKPSFMRYMCIEDGGTRCLLID